MTSRSERSGDDGVTVFPPNGEGQRRVARTVGNRIGPTRDCGFPPRDCGASGCGPLYSRLVDAALVFLLALLLTVGGTTLLWSSVALGRLAVGAARRPLPGPPPHPGPGDVAVVVAAHNEELVIRETVRSARRLLPDDNLFVVSDGSTDGTAEAAGEEGATVLALSPNRGKAGAIEAIIDEFDLAERFEVVLLLDADTQLDDDYLQSGLRQFADPDVVAVAGRAATLFDPPPPGMLGRLLVAYRERLYIAVQYLHKFGQAARWANAVAIVPGFASMYRSRVLGDIDISAAGLAIEDYNMTFEVHAKRLGRIAFHPAAAIARTQDPATFHDYTRQVRRWSLGFWQTVRRHGLRLGRFWVALAAYIVELVTSSVLLLVTPLVVLAVAIATGLAALDWDPGGVPSSISGALPLWALALGILLPDYALTVLAAIVTRRPSYLLMGPAFPLLRAVDAALCLRALVDATTRSADGRWRSPERRSAATA